MALIYWGQVDAASDITMSTIVDTSGTRTRQSVIDLISPVAAGIIAGDPTVIAAAEQAVAGALSAADILTGDDPRSPELEDYPGTSYVVMDQDVAGEVDLDASGAMKPWVLDEWKRRGAFLDGVQTDIPNTSIILGWDEKTGFPSEIDLDSAGRVKQWALDAWASRMDVSGGGGSPSTVVLAGAGQSNMAMSSARPIPAGVYAEDPRILLWAGQSATTMPATYSSVLAGVAREMRRRNPSLKIVIVNGGVGATSFTTTSINPPPEGYSYQPGGTWDHTLTADPQNLARRLNQWVKAYLAIDSEATPVLVYSGSEADLNRTDRVRAGELLDDLIGFYRSEWGTPEMSVAVSSMQPEWVATGEGSLTDQIQDALEQTPTRLERTGYFFGPLGTANANDLVHFSPTAIPDRGRLAVDALERAAGNQPGWRPQPPREIHAERRGGVATFRWVQPPGPLAGGFSVQSSTDGGSTWTAVDLRHPGQTYVTVASAGHVRLRVRTLDASGADHHSVYQTSEV